MPETGAVPIVINAVARKLDQLVARAVRSVWSEIAVSDLILDQDPRQLPTSVCYTREGEKKKRNYHTHGFA